MNERPSQPPPFSVVLQASNIADNQVHEIQLKLDGKLGAKVKESAKDCYL